MVVSLSFRTDLIHNHGTSIDFREGLTEIIPGMLYRLRQGLSLLDLGVGASPTGMFWCTGVSSMFPG